MDEILIRIDGKDYWLWIGYEPNMDLCFMMYISREGTIFVCYQFFQRIKEQIWRKP